MKKAGAALAPVFILVIIIGILAAEEGMFTPDRIKDLNLKEKGMKISPDKVFNPGKEGLQETILLMGGGTSEFVSRDGLILTNHHVAYGAVAGIASEEKNYLEDGFLAKSFKDEIPVEDIDARILRHYENVTKKILDGVEDDDTLKERKDKIKKNTEKVIDDAKKKDKSLEYSVKPFYDGNQYYLEGYFVIRDLRVVFVPPLDIGFFGGDTDNWMWPRHTGDFAFLRAYVNKKGEGSEYDKSNVPYNPKSYLKTSTEGVEEGDFVFIMGYPGTTYRFRDSYFIEYENDFYLPFVIELFESRLQVLETAAKMDVNIRLKFADEIQSYNNTMKNFVGKLEGMDKLGLVEKKRRYEDDFTAWINKNNKRREKYGDILPSLKRHYERQQERADWSFAIIAFQQCELVNIAFQILRSAGSRDIDIDKTNENFEETISNIFMPLETANYRFAWKLAQRLSGDDSFGFVEDHLAGVSDKDRLVRAVSIASEAFDLSREMGILNKEKRKEMLKMSPEELGESGDLFIRTAQMLMQEIPVIFTRQEKEQNELEILQRRLTEAFIEYWKETDRELYPDANRTFRLSYGYVKGYSPRDAVYYMPFSTLKGVVEKDTGEDPFEVPDQLKNIFKERKFGRWASSELKGMPVNLLSTLDSTGGNSGSPLLNADGELVGILFDGIYEAMTSDYEFESELTRSISVDIRYVLLITEQWGADNILKEMNVGK